MLQIVQQCYGYENQIIKILLFRRRPKSPRNQIKQRPKDTESRRLCYASFNPDINCRSLCNEAITTKTMRWHPTTLRHCSVPKETMGLWVYYINAGWMLSPEEFSEGGAGVSNRPQSRVYKILTRTRYTTVTKTNQVSDCNTRESHKDGHVGTTRAGVLS